MNKAKYLLGGVLLLFGMIPAAAKPFHAIESYGVYVVAGKGYVKVEPFAHDDRFVDFNYLDEIPDVKREGEKLKLVVYEKNFAPEAMELQLRPVDVKVRLQKVRFTVRPMEKADMYELTTESPVKDGTMLQIYYYSFFENMGVIMLGDTREELVNYFSRKQLSNAPVVIQYLNDALVAFPDNAKLKELARYWKKRADAEKDRTAYDYVEENWQKYEEAEKLTLKQRYLEAALREINGYLNEYPHGLKAKEARERKAVAEKKLKEYEKML